MAKHCRRTSDVPRTPRKLAMRRGTVFSTANIGACPRICALPNCTHCDFKLRLPSWLSTVNGLPMSPAHHGSLPCVVELYSALLTSVHVRESEPRNRCTHCDFKLRLPSWLSTADGLRIPPHTTEACHASWNCIQHC